MNHLRHRFAQLAVREDAQIDLLEGALLVAAEEDPALDLDEARAAVQALGLEASEVLAGAEDFFHAIWTINRLLYDEVGLYGDTEAYDDPENSLVHKVLERGRGIPITLSLIYREVARQAGFHVEGVALPGHYVLRWTDDWGHTFVDPFHRGRVVTRDDLARLLRERFGPRARLLDEHLLPATARQTLSRLLVNLKRIYVRREQYARALRCSERLLLLNPDATSEKRDRGLLYRRTGQREAAIHDLRGYLLERPGASDAPRIRRLLQTLLQQRSAEG